MELTPIERLAADYPGWRIDFTDSGTGYYSAHLHDGGEGVNLGSPAITGLRRLLEQQAAPQTLADLGAGLAQAGF